MPLQSAAPAEPVRRAAHDGAVEGLVASVGPHVSLQVGLVTKRLLADLADEGLFPRVHQKVALELGALVEALAAPGVLAHKLLGTVSHHVLAEHLAVRHNLIYARKQTEK